MIPKLALIQDEIKKYAEEITQAMYKTFLGQPSKMEYSTVLEKYEHLFEWEIISRLRQVEWDAGDDYRALYYLKAYMIGQWYSLSSKDMMDKINLVQIDKSIPWNGNKISIRQARTLLSNNEKNKEILRALVSEKLDNVLNPLIFEYYHKLNALSKKLNYDNFIDAANDIRRYDVKNLIDITEKFIEQSDHFFTDKIEKYCRKDSYNFSELDSLADFSSKRALEDMKYLVNQMGWSTDGIEIGWTNSKQKYSTSFCVPLSIPGKIVLVTSNGIGFNVHRHLYHEFGHGIHFMNTNPNLRYEFRRMGDHSVAEAYSALFESLMFNKSWLSERGYPTEITRFAYYHRSYLVRKYWAKLKSEYEVHTSGLYNNENIRYFNKNYSRTLNDKFDNMWWAYSLDDELNAASQIRAWLLSAQINEYLLNNFGEKWFNKRAAGEWLKELFTLGYKYNADEISQFIGFKYLNANELILELDRFK